MLITTKELSDTVRQCRTQNDKDYAVITLLLAIHGRLEEMMRPINKATGEPL